MASAANDIAYWKSEYDKAQQAGKAKTSLDWISKQAQSSYNQLDPATATAMKGMNAQQAYDYSKSQAPATSASASTNEPFTMETFANMLSSMAQPQVGTDFSKLQFTGDATTQKNMLEMMQELYATELPYQHATVKDQMANQLASQEQMGYDTSGNMTLNMSKLMGVDNFGNATLDGSIAKDKSSQDWTKIFGQDASGNQTLDAQTSWAKLLGYDSKGNQTLDARTATDDSARKWAETYGVDANGNITVSGVKANASTTTANASMLKANTDAWYKEQQASQGWANVDIRQQVANNNLSVDLQGLSIKQATLNETIANNAAKISNTTTRQGFLDQTASIKTLMNSSAAEMKRAQAVMKDYDQSTAQGQKAFEDFQKAQMEYNTAYASIDTLAQAGIVAGAAKAKSAVTTYKPTASATSSAKAGNDLSGAVSPGFNKAATDMAKTMKLTQTSGVRSAAKNKEVGGSKTSDHLTGRAADYAGTPKQMEAFAQWAAKSGKYTKVIYGGRNLITGNKDLNHDDHVHLSW